MPSWHFPSPGEKLSGRITGDLWGEGPGQGLVFNYTVIASVEFTDIYPNPYYTLLLLGTEAPYYTVVVVEDTGDRIYKPDGGKEAIQTFMNIGPAVVDGYAQMGGDW